MIDEETLQKMRVYGGSFVRQLSILYAFADSQNREKLEECFREEFEKYRNFGGERK